MMTVKNALFAASVFGIAAATTLTSATAADLPTSRALPFGTATQPATALVGLFARIYKPAVTQTSPLPRAGSPTVTPGAGHILAQPKRRQARRAGRKSSRQPECKAWKYHGADRIDRPYNPDQYNYTAEYKRGPSRLSRAEMARIAEERFPQLVNNKVLRMLELVNRVRARRGHTTMKLEPRLMVAAKRHNLDIARYALMQHTGTDCSQLTDRVWDAGHTWTKIAENLAGGNESAAATLRQWTGSSRHLMQMTLPGMTEAGIAYDYNPNPPRSGIPIKHFWTLILARPDPWRDNRFKNPEKCRRTNC